MDTLVGFPTICGWRQYRHQVLRSREDKDIRLCEVGIELLVLRVIVGGPRGPNDSFEQAVLQPTFHT